MNDLELAVVEQLPSPEDDVRWQAGLDLVAQWLLEQRGNTRLAYSDSIGWPYTASGAPRTRPLRYGVTWLSWCHRRGVHLLDARRLHIVAWLDDVDAAQHPTTGAKLTKQTKAHMLASVSSLYTWAMQEGHTETNPAALVNRSKRGLNISKDKSPSRSLSRAEVRAMQQAADNDPVEPYRLRTSAMIALLFTAGMRASELCTPTLDKMFVQDGKRVVEVTLKGGRSHLFPVAPGVARRVDAYLASRKDVDRLPARRGQVSAGSTPLFATARGLPMNRREVLRLVKRIALLSGIDEPSRVYTHVARHTVITEIRRGGGSNEAAQGVVGHLDGATTRRYGEHVLALASSPVFDVASAFGIDE